MKILIISLIAVLCTACNKDENSFARNSFQDYCVVDGKENDLLDPNNPNGINTSKINIYYLINNEKIKASEYFPNRDYPGFLISKPKGERKKYYITIYLNEKTTSGNIAYTYIEWNENDMDTIKTEVYKGANILTSTMVAFNDSIWDWESAKEDYIYKIVK
ncbi:hypothetical protein CLV62_111116 [Dysgonomonas alginatilytica]|uniref:Uncharacterized protein n=1 Tax=Dysgonomonas alginatilytica TaxID=1605892 RepID=A0A2V3PNS8_9BACT|nr:hypothetical protein [Dysgonomonas alginatilytica]PXV64158.1 hypothetical protein CLV62_111116 [Dysgonomonas alginatilytica]